MSLIRTEEYKGCSIELHYDETPENPRNWGWPDVMYLDRNDFKCDGHRISEILDNDDKLTQEFLNNHVWLWIDYYEHSNISLSTRSPEINYKGGWDKGIFGVIAVSKQDIKKETGHKIVTKKDREEYIKLLEGQVETYNQYIEGEVYGFIAKDENDDEIDSCWGYFGDEDYCISEAKDSIDQHIEELADEKSEMADRIMLAECLCDPFWSY